MTTTGWVIAIGYAIFAIAGVALALAIFRSTRVGFHASETPREELERRETRWGWVVLAFLIVLLALTIFQIPYSSDRAGASGQKLRIVGRQFAWTVQPSQVKLGDRVELDMTSADVNHAVGLYDPDDHLVKQINIFPHAHQRAVVTFDKPGTWHIYCLEFCGVDHHLMRAPIRVTR